MTVEAVQSLQSECVTNVLAVPSKSLTVTDQTCDSTGRRSEDLASSSVNDLELTMRAVMRKTASTLFVGQTKGLEVEKSGQERCAYKFRALRLVYCWGEGKGDLG